MGGFLFGLGHAAAGAGDAAQKYGAQQREIIHQSRLEATRQTMDFLQHYPLGSAEANQAIGTINKIWNDQGLLNDPKKAGSFLQNFQNLIHPHPQVIQGMQDHVLGLPTHQPTPMPPGPALPGSVAGTPQMALPPPRPSNLLPGLAAPPGEVNTGISFGGAEPGDVSAAPAGLPDFSGTVRPGSDADLATQGIGMNLATEPTPQPAPPVAAQPATSGIAGEKAIKPNAASTSLPAPPAQSAIMPPPSDIAPTPMTSPLVSAPPSPVTVPNLPPMSATAPVTPEDLYAHVPPELKYLIGSPSPAAQSVLARYVDPYVANSAELSRQKQFAEFELGYRQKAFNTLMASPQGKALPPFVQAQMQMWASTPSAPLPAMAAGMLTPHRLATGVDLRNVNPADLIDINGNPIDLSKIKTSVGNHILDLANNRSYYEPVIGPTVTGIDANGNFTAAQKLPGAPMGITPIAGLTHESVQSQPGQAPIKTVKSVNGVASPGGSQPHTILPPGGASGGSAGFNDPLAKANYDNYMSGKAGALSAPEMKGVRLYASSHGLPMPDVMSPKGQSDLAAIDPVIDEVSDIRNRLKQETANQTGRAALARDYLLYRAGFDTPHNGLFTAISFERLRSGSAALQGMPSRSRAIIGEALQHTPNLNVFSAFGPETVKAMDDKLGEMQKILTTKRQKIDQDERKGGVIAPGPQASGVPDDVREALASASPGIHKLSDGTSWMKNTDGSITKQ